MHFFNFSNKTPTNSNPRGSFPKGPQQEVLVGKARKDNRIIKNLSDPNLVSFSQENSAYIYSTFNKSGTFPLTIGYGDPQYPPGRNEFDRQLRLAEQQSGYFRRQEEQEIRRQQLIRELQEMHGDAPHPHHAAEDSAALRCEMNAGLPSSSASAGSTAMAVGGDAMGTSSHSQPSKKPVVIISPAVFQPPTPIETPGMNSSSNSVVIGSSNGVPPTSPAPPHPSPPGSTTLSPSTVPLSGNGRGPSLRLNELATAASESHPLAAAGPPCTPLFSSSSPRAAAAANRPGSSRNRKHRKSGEPHSGNVSNGSEKASTSNRYYEQLTQLHLLSVACVADTRRYAPVAPGCEAQWRQSTAFLPSCAMLTPAAAEAAASGSKDHHHHRHNSSVLGKTLTASVDAGARCTTPPPHSAAPHMGHTTHRSGNPLKVSASTTPETLMAPAREDDSVMRTSTASRIPGLTSGTGSTSTSSSVTGAAGGRILTVSTTTEEEETKARGDPDETKPHSPRDRSSTLQQNSLAREHWEEIHTPRNLPRPGAGNGGGDSPPTPHRWSANPTNTAEDVSRRQTTVGNVNAITRALPVDAHSGGASTPHGTGRVHRHGHGGVLMNHSCTNTDIGIDGRDMVHPLDRVSTFLPQCTFSPEKKPEEGEGVFYVLRRHRPHHPPPAAAPVPGTAPPEHLSHRLSGSRQYSALNASQRSAGAAPLTALCHPGAVGKEELNTVAAVGNTEPNMSCASSPQQAGLLLPLTLTSPSHTLLDHPVPADRLNVELQPALQYFTEAPSCYCRDYVAGNTLSTMKREVFGDAADETPAAEGSDAADGGISATSRWTPETLEQHRRKLRQRHRIRERVWRGEERSPTCRATEESGEVGLSPEDSYYYDDHDDRYYYFDEGECQYMYYDEERDRFYYYDEEEDEYRYDDEPEEENHSRSDSSDEEESTGEFRNSATGRPPMAPHRLGNAPVSTAKRNPFAAISPSGPPPSSSCGSPSGSRLLTAPRYHTVSNSQTRKKGESNDPSQRRGSGLSKKATYVTGLVLGSSHSLLSTLGGSAATGVDPAFREDATVHPSTAPATHPAWSGRLGGSRHSSAASFHRGSSNRRPDGRAATASGSPLRNDRGENVLYRPSMPSSTAGSGVRRRRDKAEQSGHRVCEERMSELLRQKDSRKQLQSFGL